jgi:hypothetical protein
MLRDYPPGAVFHSPSCPEINGHSAPSIPVMRAVAENPSHQYCMCTGGNQDAVPYVVIQRVDYGDHLYVPSPNWPHDATRALCRTCRGTHGESRPGEPSPLGLVIPRA